MGLFMCFFRFSPSSQVLGAVYIVRCLKKKQMAQLFYRSVGPVCFLYRVGGSEDSNPLPAPQKRAMAMCRARRRVGYAAAQ